MALRLHLLRCMTDRIAPLLATLEQDLSYNHHGKEAFHRRAKLALRLIAAKLGLTPGEFNVVSM